MSHLHSIDGGKDNPTLGDLVAHAESQGDFDTIQTLHDAWQGLHDIAVEMGFDEKTRTMLQGKGYDVELHDNGQIWASIHIPGRRYGLWVLWRDGETISLEHSFPCGWVGSDWDLCDPLDSWSWPWTEWEKATPSVRLNTLAQHVGRRIAREMLALVP